MADNVDITPGAGATVAADLVGGALYQRVKLSIGGDGSAADTPGDTTNGIDVDPTRVPVDAAATTGSLTAADVGSTTTVNSIGQVVVTGTPTANSAVVCALAGHGAVVLQISGTHSTTCKFERSTDGGTTYVAMSMEVVDAGASGLQMSMTDNKAYVFRANVSGFTHVRVRCSTYGSGTASVRWQPSNTSAQIAVNQGTPSTVAQAWTVKLTDGVLTAGLVDETGAGAVDAQAVGGGTPHDAVDSGNPVKIGGYAKATAPSDVSADGDRVAAWLLRNGAQVVALTSAGALIGAFTETGSSGLVALAVGGGTPHDSVDSGNPVKLGARAIAHGTNPTAVAAADRTDLLANRAGVPFAIGGHPNVVTLKHTTITTAVTDAAIVTVSSGLKIVVTRLTVTLDNASTVFPSVLIGFGATNTPTTTGVLAAHGGVPAGGGFTIGDGSGMLGIGADGEDLRVTTTGNATGNGLQITVSYYTIES